MNITTYVYSLILLALFVTVFSFIIPNGKLKKTIKIVVSSVLIISVFKPLLKIKSENFDFDYGSYDDLEYQEGYVFYINGLKNSEREKACNKILADNGIKDSKIQIEYSDLTCIYVNKVIIFTDENIIVDEKVLKDIANVLGVDESLVCVYEGK